MRVRYEEKPIAVYFKNVRRDPWGYYEMYWVSV